MCAHVIEMTVLLKVIRGGDAGAVGLVSGSGDLVGGTGNGEQGDGGGMLGSFGGLAWLLSLATV